MNIDRFIKAGGECDNTWRIERAIRVGYVLATYKPQIDKWEERYPDYMLDVAEDGIELKTEDREQILFFIQVFGGQFKKFLEDYQKDKIRYDQEHPDLFGRDGDYYKFRISIRNATPPPSCQIVEYEEAVPATTIKKRKIVCPVDEAFIEKTVSEQEEETANA